MLNLAVLRVYYDGLIYASEIEDLEITNGLIELCVSIPYGDWSANILILYPSSLFDNDKPI